MLQSVLQATGWEANSFTFALITQNLLYKF